MTREQVIANTWDTVLEIMANPEAEASLSAKILLVDHVVAQIQNGDLDYGLDRLDKAVNLRIAVPNKCFLGDANSKRKGTLVTFVVASIQEGFLDVGLFRILQASYERSETLNTQKEDEPRR
jgi:hypothetical protein